MKRGHVGNCALLKDACERKLHMECQAQPTALAISYSNRSEADKSEM